MFEARTYLAISANRERFPEHERNDEDEDGQEEHSTRGQRWREAWQCNGSGSGPGLGAKVRQWHREREKRLELRRRRVPFIIQSYMRILQCC